MPDEAAHPVLRLSKADQRSIFLHGLLIFAATFALTIAGGVHALKTGSYAPSNAVSVPYFLTVFLLATLTLIFALQISRRGTLFQVLFSIAMLSGAWFVADLFLPPGAALIAGSAVILLRFVWKTALFMNLSLAIGIAGIAASIATGLTVNALLIILTILAFYDIVAVYATKHMVRMFRGLMARGVVFAFVLTRLRPAELVAPAAGPAASSAMLLGTGDVALPAMLAAAALREHPARPVVVALGAMAGFALMFFLFLRQARRRPMAALPPIALGAIVFYFASLLIFPAS